MKLTEPLPFVRLCASIGYMPEDVVTTLTEWCGMTTVDARLMVEQEYHARAAREAEDAAQMHMEQ